MTDVTNDTTGPDGKFDGFVVQPVPVASTPAIVSLDTQVMPAWFGLSGPAYAGLP